MIIRKLCLEHLAIISAKHKNEQKYHSQKCKIIKQMVEEGFRGETIEDMVYLKSLSHK